MMRQYMTSLIAFILIDFIWLVWIAPRFYQAHIGHLMSVNVDMKAAVAFYLIFLAGLNLFVLAPNWASSYKKMAAYGAAFGFVTYATFDLTSQAVFKDFPTIVVVVDLLWGSFLSMGIAVGTTFLYRSIWGGPQTMSSP